MYEDNEIIDIANDNHLTIIETTTSSNGYPANLKRAVTGLDDFNHALELSKKHNLKIAVFYKKDGWDLWYRDGNEVFAPIKPNVENFGDNYREYYKDEYTSLDDFYTKEFSYIKDGINNLSFDDLNNELNRIKKLYEDIQSIDSDEVFITDGYTKYVYPKEMMQYTYDTSYFIIGLIKE